MTSIDVTRLISDIDPIEFSASIAERGKNAGPETWANAKAEATERPLSIDDREGVKEYFAGFGAWEREEIAAWSDSELDALVLQYASGDLREVQSLCPGNGLGDINWRKAEKLAHAGTISGNLYANGNQLFIELCE
jgi:hypothetical protein